MVWLIEGGSAAPYEALTILAIVIANAVLGYVQEARAEAAIASLRKMTAAAATVLRDGERRVVPAAEIVPGDLLAIEEGNAIPADARVIHSVSLQFAEAALTGESTPVEKGAATLPRDAALADRTNMVFAGTAATYGHGLAIVTATGMHAEIGRIAGLLASTQAERTPLQAQLDGTGRILGVAVIGIAIIVGATLLALQREFTAAVLTGILLYTVALGLRRCPKACRR